LVVDKYAGGGEDAAFYLLVGWCLRWVRLCLPVRAKSSYVRGWLASAWFEDAARRWLAGISSGSRAAKTLRKHARISVAAWPSFVPRAFLQIFHHDHAELLLNWRCGALLRVE
jgi:hypothetical protein